MSHRADTKKMQGKGYASILTAQPVGIGAELVTVEADLSRGLHAFSIVGLADKAVAEARDRTSSAIKNAGYKPPKAANRRIVLSLSPASLPKDGSQYDLPLALAYLIAAGHVLPPLERMLLCGELGLDGTVRPIRNVLAHAQCARRAGIELAVVPKENAQEAMLVSGLRIYPVAHITELIAHLNGEEAIQIAKPQRLCVSAYDGIDFADIRGQESAKRALMIAAAGRHNIMLYGPPGTGKTMLARAFAGILPPLTERESLTATSIHSAAGILPPGTIVQMAPFRSPHHTISTSAMIGGGPMLRPGEVSLAHSGVLFMDEFVEFDARTLEALRQPLEDKVVNIARTKGAMTFPADFIFVGAMNPADTLTGDDQLIRKAAQKQARKLSRPIIDRIDLWVEVPRLSHQMLAGRASAPASDDIRAAVAKVRKRRAQTKLPCASDAQDALRLATERLSLSVRGHERTKRVAQTIAFLEEAKRVELPHMLEALQYRPRLPGIA